MGSPYLYNITLSFLTAVRSCSQLAGWPHLAEHGHYQGADTPSDSLNVAFGVRMMTSALDERGNRVYSVNGQKILIRGGCCGASALRTGLLSCRSPHMASSAGAGWAPDLLLRQMNPRGPFADR
jgi:hypothetical protein